MFCGTHPLLEFNLFFQGHGVCLGDNRDDVYYFAEVFHELQVQRSQAVTHGKGNWKSYFTTLPIMAGHHLFALPGLRDESFF